MGSMDESSLMSRLPPIQQGHGSFSFGQEGGKESPLDGGSSCKPQRPRETIMQKLNEKYSEPLHDSSLVAVRKLAALNAKNTRSAMHMQLGGIGAPGKGMFGADTSIELGDLASRTNSTVHLLTILAKHQQRKAALGMLTDTQGWTHEDAQDTGAGENSREVTLKVGLRARLSNTSPICSSAVRPPPLSQLAFQDFRRASEIKSALELNDNAVSVSTALDPKEPLGRKARQQQQQQQPGQGEEGETVENVASSGVHDAALSSDTVRSAQLAPIDSSGSRPGTSSKSISLDAVSSIGSPSRAVSAASPAHPPASSRPESRSKSPAAEGGGKKGTKKGGDKGGKKGEKKSGKKSKKAVIEGPEPILSLLRVGGPITPFLPGTVRESHPEQWIGNNRRTADALIQRNPAAYDKDAAELELSLLQEATERASMALEFAAALPKDRFASSMVSVSVQEVRSRRPFLRIPEASTSKAHKAPAQVPYAILPEKGMVGCGAEGETGSGGISGSIAATPPPSGEAVKEGEQEPQPDQESRPPSPSRTPAPARPRVVGWLFNPESSVFSSRLKYSDAKAMVDLGALEQQLNVDWKVAVARDSLRRFVFTEDVEVLSERCKVDHALESIRLVLSKHVMALRPIFEYYSISTIVNETGRGRRDVHQLAINREGWHDLLRVMAITDAGCNRLTHQEKCEAVYTESVGPSGLLDRPSFYEALIRLSAQKYVRLGPHDSVALGLDNLITDNLRPGGPLPPEARHDVSLYRRERLYQQGTDDAIRKNWTVLQAMFDYGLSHQEGSVVKANTEAILPGTTSNKNGRTIGLVAWLQILRDFKLLDGPIVVSERDVVTIFCWSRLAVVSESLSKSICLPWADFLEAFARLADLISPPPREELEVLLREVIKVPEEELEAEMAPGGHPYHSFYTQCPPNELKKFRRSSARGGLCTDKTQPLGDKVEALLDFVVPFLSRKLPEAVLVEEDLQEAVPLPAVVEAEDVATAMEHTSPLSAEDALTSEDQDVVCNGPMMIHTNC